MRLDVIFQDYLDAWKSLDADRIMAFFADDVEITVISLSKPISGKDAVRQEFVEPFLAGFEGSEHEDAGEFSRFMKSNEVAFPFVFKGKHVATVLGVPPCNKQIEIQGVEYFRFNSNGKICNLALQHDHYGFLVQAGVTSIKPCI